MKTIQGEVYRVVEERRDGRESPLTRRLVAVPICIDVFPKGQEINVLSTAVYAAIYTMTQYHKRERLCLQFYRLCFWEGLGHISDTTCFVVFLQEYDGKKNTFEVQGMISTKRIDKKDVEM